MPGGRPTKLDQVVRHRPDGTPVTAGDQIIERTRLGMDQKGACDSAGVDRVTLHRWHLAGGRLRAEQAQGKLPHPTPNQLALIEFCNNLERAQAEAEANRLAIIERAAVGGAVTTKTTEKREVLANGTERVLERTVVTETLAPQWTAAAWWLERRMPAKYARRVEVTGADGSPLVPQDQQARDLADSLRDFLAGAAAAQEVAADA